MPPKCRRRKKVKLTFNNPFLQTMAKDLSRISANEKRRASASAASEKRLRTIEKKQVNFHLDETQRALKGSYYFRVGKIKTLIDSDDYLRELKAKDWVDQSVTTFESASSSDDEEEPSPDVKAEKAKPLKERILNYKAFVRRSAFHEYKASGEGQAAAKRRVDNAQGAISAGLPKL